MTISIRPLAVTHAGATCFLPVAFDTSAPLPDGALRVPDAEVWCDDRALLSSLEAPRYPAPDVLGDPLVRFTEWARAWMNAQPSPPDRLWSLRRRPSWAYVLPWFASSVAPLPVDDALAILTPRLAPFGYGAADIRVAIDDVRARGALFDLAPVIARLEADHHARLVAERDAAEAMKREAAERARIAATPIETTLAALGLIGIEVGELARDAVKIGVGRHFIAAPWPGDVPSEIVLLGGALKILPSDTPVSHLPDQHPPVLANSDATALITRAVQAARKERLAQDGPVKEEDLHGTDTPEGRARLAAGLRGIAKHGISEPPAMAEFLIRGYGIALEDTFEAIRTKLHEAHDHENAQRLARYIEGGRGGRTNYFVDQVRAPDRWNQQNGSPKPEIERVEKWTSVGSLDDPRRPKPAPYTGLTDAEIANMCEAALEHAEHFARGEFFDPSEVEIFAEEEERPAAPDEIAKWGSVFLAVVGSRTHVASEEIKTAITDAGLAPAKWRPRDHAQAVTVANSLGWLAGMIRPELRDGTRGRPCRGFRAREEPMPLPDLEVAS